MPAARRRRPPPAEEVGEHSARRWAGIESESSRRILLAALAAFARHGFQAATTREISERAGMSPAAIYVHYAAKMRDAPADPEERVRRFVAAFAKRLLGAELAAGVEAGVVRHPRPGGQESHGDLVRISDDVAVA